MIASVTGTVAAIGPTWAVVTVGGVGLRLLCPPETATTLRQGQPAEFATSLVVREDSLTLYGFSLPAERDTFELVQTATGIGPRIALALVSVLTPAELRAALLNEDLVALCRVPGIGKRGAQRLVLELKDKALTIDGDLDDAPSAVDTGSQTWRDQVRSGLEGLGWSTKDADAAVERVQPMAEENPEASIADLMRAALRTLAK